MFVFRKIERIRLCSCSQVSTNTPNRKRGPVVTINMKADIAVVYQNKNK